MRSFVIGSGPGTFNEALTPYYTEEGSPSIDTDEMMMFNIGVNEPDTFSCYAVWLVENGILGVIVLIVSLTVPAVIGFRKKGQAKALNIASSASLLGLAVINIFHSHMITGVYILAVCITCIAVTDFVGSSEDASSVQENGLAEKNPAQEDC